MRVAGRTRDGGRAQRSTAPRVVVRDCGRDSVLVWANLLLAPLVAALGLRVGIVSEERRAARIEADTARLRQRGYLVSSVQSFTLPGIAGRSTDARWCRVTFERPDDAVRGPSAG
jgi:hypothetical protein